MKGPSKTDAKRGTSTPRASGVSPALSAQQPTPPASRIDPALTAFDSLPDSSFVRQRVVQSLFACGRTTIWRRVKAGTLPKPRKFSDRVTAWRVGDLREVLKRAA